MRIYRFNGSFLSLVFLSLITGFIALALFAKTLPLIAAKTLYFCQQFVSNALSEIPQSLPNTVVFMLGVALFLGILSFFIQLWKTKTLIKSLLVKRVKISRRVKDIIIPLGLGGRVYLINDINLFSFCSGIFSPRIIITTSLTDSLNTRELEAVFLHEKAHLQSHDPFKILLGKTIVSMFFFLPIFSQLNKNMNATNEILADRFAVGYQQDTLYLRNALRKILSTPQINLSTVPAVSNSDYLEIRVTRLVNPGVKHNFRVSALNILISLSFFVLSFLLLQVPVNAFHMESSLKSSYFLCSTDNACRQQCHHNATSTISAPEELFSPVSNPFLTNNNIFYYTR